MKKLIYKFLKEYIEKHYHIWGIRLETDLPPEFIITEHAVTAINARFKCKPEKMYRIMLKAWKSKETLAPWLMEKQKYIHEESIYKVFNGFVFVFRTRYNKRKGSSQKYLITVFKKSGYQIYD